MKLYLGAATISMCYRDIGQPRESVTQTAVKCSGLRPCA